jgi:hypothetical protein
VVYSSFISFNALFSLFFTPFLSSSFFLYFLYAFLIL